MLRKLFAKFHQNSVSGSRVIPTDKSVHGSDLSDEGRSIDAIIMSNNPLAVEGINRSRQPSISMEAREGMNRSRPSSINGENRRPSGMAVFDNARRGSHDIDKSREAAIREVTLLEHNTRTIIYLNSLNYSIRRVEGMFPTKIMVQLMFVDYRIPNEKINEEGGSRMSNPLITVLRSVLSTSTSISASTAGHTSDTAPRTRESISAELMLAATNELNNILQCYTCYSDRTLALDGGLAAIDILLSKFATLIVMLSSGSLKDLRSCLTAIVNLLAVYQDVTLAAIGYFNSEVSFNIVNQIVCSICQLLYLVSEETRKSAKKWTILSPELIALLQKLSTVLLFTRRLAGNTSDTPIMFFWQTCEAVYDNVVFNPPSGEFVNTAAERSATTTIISNIILNSLSVNMSVSDSLYKSVLCIVERQKHRHQYQHKRNNVNNNYCHTHDDSDHWKSFNTTILGLQFLSRLYAKEMTVINDDIELRPLALRNGNRKSRQIDHIRLLLEVLLYSVHPSKWSSEDSVKVSQVLVNNLLLAFSSFSVDADSLDLTPFDDLTQILETFIRRWKFVNGSGSSIDGSCTEKADNESIYNESYDDLDPFISSSRDNDKDRDSPPHHRDSFSDVFDKEFFSGSKPGKLHMSNICASPIASTLSARSISSPNSTSILNKKPMPHGILLHSSSYTLKEIIYAIGDNVDGLCILKNSTKRWFPGQITAVSINTNTHDGSLKRLYSIRFNDGEEQHLKDSTEIRTTKSRRNSGVSVRSCSSSDAPPPLALSGAVSIPRMESQSSIVSAIESTERTGTGTGAGTTGKDAVMPRGRGSINLTIGVGVGVGVGADSAPGSPVLLSRMFPHIPRHPQSSQSSAPPSGRNSYKSELPPLLDGVATPKHRDSLQSSKLSSSDSPRSVIVSEEEEEGDDGDCDEEEGDSDGSASDNNIFEIPSVLAQASPGGIMRPKSISFVDVPRMEFKDLDLSAAAPMPSNGSFSLSGSILRDQHTTSSRMNTGDSTQLQSYLDDGSVGMGMGTSRGGTARSLYSHRKNVLSRKNSSRISAPNSQRDNIAMSSNTNINTSTNTNISSRSLNVNKNIYGEAGRDMIMIQEEDVRNDVDIDFALWAPVFVGVSTLLLKRCLLRGEFLDVTSCLSKFQDLSVAGAEMQPNTVFTLREFLETPYGISSLPQMASVANLTGNASTRLLKLLSVSHFQSCLSKHQNDMQRIADGGFGSVHRIKCPPSCEHCSSSEGKNYAVKRLTRERSAHDRPIILDVFTEISCLEKLAGYKGVCKLIDYGVNEGEYWMVLEEGKRDLLSWRLEQNEESSVSDSALDANTLHVYVNILQDVVEILKYVHSSGIVHFDLKCSNFILRQDITREKIRAARDSRSHSSSGSIKHNNNNNSKLSELLFIADFGESIFCMPELSQEAALQIRASTIRSRGTLPIQSPEVLRLTENNSKSKSTTPAIATTIATAVKAMIVDDPSFHSDIWSLGCMFVELITGKYLFEGKTWTEMYVSLCLNKTTTTTFPMDSFETALRGVDVNISTLLHGIVMSCLRPTPSQRCSLGEVSATLDRIESLLNKSLAVKSSVVLPTPPLNVGSFRGRGLVDNNNIAEFDSKWSKMALDARRCEETVCIPGGVWHLGRGVWFECSSDLILDTKEKRLAANHVSDLLFSRIDEGEALAKNSRLDKVIRTMCDNQVEKILRVCGSFIPRDENNVLSSLPLSDHREGIAYASSGKKREREELGKFHCIHLRSTSDLSVANLVKVFDEAKSHLDRGVVVIVSLEASSESDHDHNHGDKDRDVVNVPTSTATSATVTAVEKDPNNDCVCSRLLLTCAVSLAFSLTGSGRNITDIDLDENHVESINRLVPWIRGHCCKDLTTYLHHNFCAKRQI